VRGKISFEVMMPVCGSTLPVNLKFKYDVKTLLLVISFNSALLIIVLLTYSSAFLLPLGLFEPPPSLPPVLKSTSLILYILKFVKLVFEIGCGILVAVGVGVGVTEGVGLGDLVGVTDGVLEGVGETDGVARGDVDGVGEGVAVTEGVIEGVGDGEGGTKLSTII